MSNVAQELREASLRAEQEGEPIALLDDAAGEIERLQSLTRFQDRVIRSGDTARLTQAEAAALDRVVIAYELLPTEGAGQISEALRGLLERLGGEPC